MEQDNGYGDGDDRDGGDKKGKKSLFVIAEDCSRKRKKMQKLMMITVFWMISQHHEHD